MSRKNEFGFTDSEGFLLCIFSKNGTNVLLFCWKRFILLAWKVLLTYFPVVVLSSWIARAKQFLPPCVFHSFAKITSLGLRVLPLYKSAETVFDDSVFSFWLFVFSMTAKQHLQLCWHQEELSAVMLLSAHERVNFNPYCKVICSSVSCFCSYFFCKFNQFSHM